MWTMIIAVIDMTFFTAMSCFELHKDWLYEHKSTDDDSFNCIAAWIIAINDRICKQILNSPLRNVDWTASESFQQQQARWELLKAADPGFASQIF